MVTPPPIPDNWQEIKTYLFFEAKHVSRILLKDGVEIEIVPGSYMEVGYPSIGAEVYVGTEVGTGYGIMGPINNVVNYWFIQEASTNE